MRGLALATLLLLAAAVAGLWFALRPAPAPSTARFDVAQALGGEADPKFARAEAPRPFRFPQDHGPHPEFRNEWWYFTGNLFGTDGQRFGYELSLFRIALSPEARPRASAWATSQAYMGHFALTDAHGKRFHFFERFARGGAGLAGARADPFAVWLEDWRVSADSAHRGTWRIWARQADVAIDLRVTPAKPIVLQGDRGLSRKSAEPGNASYYYSIPRLATEGTISIGDKAAHVRGSSWLDREWSTSALGPDQVGWDWFALQLDDGHELMFYRLRQRDGGTDPFSAGTWIDPAGHASRLAAQDVTIEVLEHWSSPRGDAQGRASPGPRGSAPGPRGVTYPARWRLTVASVQLSLEVRPVLADQELDVSVRYWEGAVDVAGTRAGRRVAGVGYVELTGYAGTPGERARRMAR